MSIALFADLDGTLIPPELVRRDGEVPEELDLALRELSHLVPIAIVTTKDCRTAYEKVPYAKAFACINGIEIKAGGYTAIADDLRAIEMEQLVRRARSLDAYIDAKRTSDGRWAGLTIDWRETGAQPKGLEELLAYAEGLGMTVLRYRRHPMADIFASKKNKGDAVKLLKAMLGVSYVVYMGDSDNDIPAWRMADVRILVRNQYNADLKIEGVVPIRFEELPRYIRSVIESMKQQGAV